MKKLIVIILYCFFFFNNCFAQPFGANNAVWHYEVQSQMPPYTISPITINGSCNVINNIPYCTFSINPAACATSSAYSTYESNDSVYYYLPTLNTWSMLYNFNAIQGDTQAIYGENVSGALDSLLLKVDTTGIITVNGFNKKFYSTSNLLFPSNFSFGVISIEDIGSIGFLFPQYSFCDPLIGGLKCYEDTIIELYQPLQSGINCDTVIYFGENELNFIQNILISPNPSTDFITIYYNLTSHSQAILSLFNLYGQKPKTILNERQPAGVHEMKIDVKDLEAGICFVKASVGVKEEVRKVVRY